MPRAVPCDTPKCAGEVWVSAVKPWPKSGKIREYNFCARCRAKHSYNALATQAVFEKPIEDVILDARMFRTACHMADYIGVSFVTLYHWIAKYFGMSFQEFRRKYICKSEDCYLLNVYQATYNRQDYILKKIRDKRYCACAHLLEDHIMTNAPLNVVSAILAGCPRIGKISDDVFVLLPSPVYFEDRVQPVYDLLNLSPVYV